MSLGPHTVMPGAFHLEAPNGAAPLSRARAGITRPPLSPSAVSSMYSTKSTDHFYADASTPTSNVKRKRLGDMESTPHHYATNLKGDANERPLPARRISSGREVRYTLAGQIETPNGATQRQLGDMEDSAYSDVDYRRGLGSKRSHQDLGSPLSRYTGPQEPQQGGGWSRFALDTIGGVVGKVWEFCKEGAFVGFYAGSGKGYEMHPMANDPVWCSEQDVPTLPNYDTASSIPGGFPGSEYAPFPYERETPESTPPPAAKRRQIFDGTVDDDLRKHWVMVKDPADKMPQSHFHPRAPNGYPPSTLQARPSLNRRISKPVSRLVVPTLDRCHSNRISHAGAATLTNRQPASFASPRSPVIPDRPATPSRLPVPSCAHSPNALSPRLSYQPPRIPSPNPYSARGHRRARSAASAISIPTGATGRVKRRESSVHEIIEERSPRLDADAKDIVVRRMKREKEADARINDFNARLMDMIRQGKEALGTSVEVDEDSGGLDPWEDD
ncbi:hypothetical protein BJ170DRAFT_680853 [Xylariales sp. AK1849]|nr:hypothetical protein BJ170DRAFT_680853 [Xylariales sp. AK1849]